MTELEHDPREQGHVSDTCLTCAGHGRLWAHRCPMCLGTGREAHHARPHPTPVEWRTVPGSVDLGREAPPVVLGGQGRTPQDVDGDGAVVGYVLLALAVLALVAAVSLIL